MRVTNILFRQHIGRIFEHQWWVQSKRKTINTGTEQILKAKGIPVFKPEEILEEKRTRDDFEVIGHMEKPQPLDHTHPNWSAKTLLTYKDSNVLVEGLAQAKTITKTIELKEGLPKTLVLEDLTKDVNKRIHRIIMSSHVYDAEQKKLPIVKDPARPAWNFPRSYGITQDRVNKLLTSKILQLIETTSPLETVKQKYILNDLNFQFPFERNGNQIQFQLRGDCVITSSKPLTPITNISTETFDLPDIFPIQPTISLNEENIYTIENIYPISPSILKSHPHTVFVYLNRDETKNLFEEEVTESQILGRSLLKAFTVAASYARQQYGPNVKDLAKPVVVQCVQTDGKIFHFGILQLNTLNLEEGNTKNVWYQTSVMSLFDNCSYKVGKPVLEGYNVDVIKHLYAFYNNV